MTIQIRVEEVGAGNTYAPGSLSRCGEEVLLVSPRNGLAILQTDGSKAQHWATLDGDGTQFGSCAVKDYYSGLVFSSIDSNEHRAKVAVASVPEASKKLAFAIVDVGFAEDDAVQGLCIVQGVQPDQHGSVVVAVSASGCISILAARLEVRVGPPRVSLLRVIEKLPIPDKTDSCIWAESAADGLCLLSFAKETGPSGIAVAAIKFSTQATGEHSYENKASTRDVAEDSRPLSPVDALRGVAWEVLPIVTPEVGHSRRRDVLGCTIQPGVLIVLYTRGLLHTYQTRGARSVGQCGPSVERLKLALGREAIVANRRHSVVLEDGEGSALAGSPMDKKIAPSAALGGVISLGWGFALVLYDRVASVWDGIYGTGHGYVELPGAIHSFSAGNGNGCAALQTTTGSVYSLRVDVQDICRGPSLGMALQNQSACTAVVKHSSQADVLGSAPMLAQPVVGEILRSAADGGHDAASRLEKFFRAENKVENTRLQLSSRPSATPNASDLKRLIRQSTEGASTPAHPTLTSASRKQSPNAPVKKGVQSPEPGFLTATSQRFPSATLALAKLPTERTAATVVARCVYEVHRGDLSFVEPLIDMVASGVVSNDLVVLSLQDIAASGRSDDDDVSIPASLIAPLLKDGKCMNAVEAVMLRVADLSEKEVVRTIQRTLRMEKDDIKNLARQPKLRAGARDAKLFGRTPGQRVLGRCLSRSFEPAAFSEALRCMHIHDVILFLEYLRLVIGHIAIAQAIVIPPAHADSIRDSKGVDDRETQPVYRGERSWLDEPAWTDLPPIHAVTKIQGHCVDLASRLVDAHMPALIVDAVGSRVATRLLKVVRKHKLQAEALAPLEGMSRHFRQKRRLPTPGNEWRTFKQIRKLPAGAALR